MSATSWTTKALFLKIVFLKNNVGCINYSANNLTRILRFRSHHRVQMTGIEPALHRWNYVLSVAGLPFPHIWMIKNSVCAPGGIRTHTLPLLRRLPATSWATRALFLLLLTSVVVHSNSRDCVND